ncbi:MAG TPA: alanine racemase [Oscillatoriaceae cyanobacterium]
MLETNTTAFQRAHLKGAMEQAALRGAWLGIDLIALAANVRAIKNFLRAGTRLMAVVKADAYGHGAVAIAETAIQNGASALGVATVEEGARLRRAGIRAPILVLGLVPDGAYRVAVEQDLQLTISSYRQAQVLERVSVSVGKVSDVHVKVNTGMTRVGCELHEAPGLARFVLDSRAIRLVGVSTHLACAEESLAEDAEAQLARFRELDKTLRLNPARVLRHAANSAATIYLPDSHLDMVRVGLALYGHSPRGRETAPLALTPILSLRARIAQVKEVPTGARVGYGGTWSATRATRLALIPVGYADGLPRALSNAGEAIVRGVRCPLVGRISMDQSIIDVGALPVEPGEEVLLLGGHGTHTIPVEQWADLDRTVNYEILCGLGQRLPKVYYR